MYGMNSRRHWRHPRRDRTWNQSNLHFFVLLQIIVARCPLSWRRTSNGYTPIVEYPLYEELADILTRQTAASSTMTVSDLPEIDANVLISSKVEGFLTVNGKEAFWDELMNGEFTLVPFSAGLTAQMETTLPQSHRHFTMNAPFKSSYYFDRCFCELLRFPRFIPGYWNEKLLQKF